MKTEVYNHIKRFVKGSTLTKAITSLNDVSDEAEDIINDIWIAFFEAGKDKKFEEQDNLSLKSYVYNYTRWCLVDKFRFEIRKNIYTCTNIDIEDDNYNILNINIEKELSAIGYELKLYYRGFTQQSIANSLGISKQAVNKRIKKQIKKYINNLTYI